jgi:hypothetical protein
MKNTQATVADYRLFAGNGRYIRKATMVSFPDGRVVKFIDRIPSKGEAIRQAMEVQ